MFSSLNNYKNSLLGKLTKLKNISFFTHQSKKDDLYSKEPQLISNKVIKQNRTKHGAMKTKIFQALAEAGPSGIKIAALSQKIGAKSANVSAWFNNSGKNFSEIERIKHGYFRLREQPITKESVSQENISSDLSPLKKNHSTKQGRSKRRKKQRRVKYGTMKTKIFQALVEAGPSGIKIAALSQKTGIKSTNISVWLSTTGKNFSEIERIGYGRIRFCEKITKKED